MIVISNESSSIVRRKKLSRKTRAVRDRRKLKIKLKRETTRCFESARSVFEVNTECGDIHNCGMKGETKSTRKDKTVASVATKFISSIGTVGQSKRNCPSRRPKGNVSAKFCGRIQIR